MIEEGNQKELIREIRFENAFLLKGKDQVYGKERLILKGEREDKLRAKITFFVWKERGQVRG